MPSLPAHATRFAGRALRPDSPPDWARVPILRDRRISWRFAPFATKTGEKGGLGDDRGVGGDNRDRGSVRDHVDSGSVRDSDSVRDRNSDSDSGSDGGGEFCGVTAQAAVGAGWPQRFMVKCGLYWSRMKGITHRVAEERSSALHREVAKRLLARPDLLERARSRVEGWSRERSVAAHWIKEWSVLLSHSLEDVIAAITDTGEAGRGLRQTSPFAGIIDSKTRWEILRRCERERRADET